MSDLVKRLRGGADCIYDGLAVDLITEAADEIERQAEIIERLTMLTNYKQEPLLHSERKP